MPNHSGDDGAGPVEVLTDSPAADQVADVLLDRIQLGLDILLPVKATPHAAAQFCKGLVRAGFLAKAPAAGAILDRKLAIGPASVSLPSVGVATLSGRMDLVATKAGNLQVRRTSTLLPDAMCDSAWKKDPVLGVIGVQ